MRFLHPEHDGHLELALEDVFLVPRFFEGASRLDVDITPRDFPLGSHPVVAANMNAVTGKRMAETMARYGGLGVLPQDMRLDTVKRIVRHVHAADPRFDTPLEVTVDATLRDVQGIIRKRSHGLVVVIDDQRRPLGIITQTDLKDRDQYTRADRLMSPGLVTLPQDCGNREAFLKMEEHHVRAAPVVDSEGRLVGILTKEDTVRSEILRPTLDDQGRLSLAAAIGISSEAPKAARDRFELGLRVLVIDTAHGHQRRMLESIRDVRQELGDEVVLVAGNVCTAEGTAALIDAGADIVKVNVGPGAMCTTRMQTGVGRPSFSSVRECAEEARRRGKSVWADGGVRHPRDVALYLAAGASRVMIGTMLAATFESPGDIKEDPEGRLYKENYGMASARAVSERTADSDAFDRAKKGFFEEGISSSRIYFRPDRGAVGAIMVEFMTGLRSALTYVGAKDLETFAAMAVVGVQSAHGYGEGTPHGRVRH
ncbi:MAG: GuaB1 family IMP dehydrogenase-related protein [Myxococcales bacterium]|nr:GuaB1 family IMP dehydrogenase-related protein [Myxococcales bacterium]